MLPSRISADSQDEMLASIHEAVPTGTPIDDAKKQMERFGFDCELVERGSFSENPAII
jgi:hypothetical protein